MSDFLIFDIMWKGRPLVMVMIVAQAWGDSMAQVEPLTWEGMPRWSVEGSVYKPLSSTSQRVQPPLQSGYTTDDGPGWRVGGTYRWAGRFEAMVAVEWFSLRSSGLQNSVIDSTWTIPGGWFGPIYYTAYQADDITIGHTVHALCLGVGFLERPVPAGKVALRAELRGGLRIQTAAASFGTEHLSGVWNSNLFSDVFPGPGKGDWSRRTEVDTQRSMGLAVDLGIRLRLWLGQHISLLLPDAYITLPVIKPSFDAVSAGEVYFEPHELDLGYGTVGVGLGVHW